MYGGLIVAVQRGNFWMPPLVVLLASPILLASLALTLEGRGFSIFDLGRQSWAFAIGDSLALTTAFALAALAWRKMPADHWSRSPSWIVASLAIGLLAGAGFHALDTKGYRVVGAGQALLSPTKLAHDFVTYPVLFGGLVCVGVPLLAVWGWWSWYVMSILICVLVWATLVAADVTRGNLWTAPGVYRLDPKWLHPAWDAQRFRPVAFRQ